MQETLWERLCHEHHRLDAVLCDVRGLAQDRAFATAAKRFGEFRLHEERNLQAEERLLSLLERLPGPAPRVVNELRQEHRQVRQLLEEANLALGCRDSSGFASRLSALQQTLAAHQADERTFLVPELEASLADEDSYRELLFTLDG